ncbi:Uncharacterised protein [Mycobacterium tuberculosis]|nr:Uncharacterised protein [Mycobacterium tuberculosis]
MVDPLADVFFHPHAGAACAATKAAVGMARHLGQAGPRGTDQLPWCLVDLVVPTQVARVVVGDVLRNRSDRDQPLVAHQPIEQLGVVQHGVVGAQLPISLADGVEAVRAGDNDLAVDGLHTLEQTVQGLDGLLCQLLEEELVAGAARRVAVAGFPSAQHQVFHPGDGEQLGDGLGGLLGLVVVGARTTHPEQVLVAVEAVDVLAVHGDVEVNLVDPVGAI